MEKGCSLSHVAPKEIWSLGLENFEKLKPVHRFVFLFKWQPGEEPAGSVFGCHYEQHSMDLTSSQPFSQRANA
ncbi:hypothetical protein HPG69_011257 [Diceros bicornis minor]|uniref:Uncharacterized protein n=1 Tax=Diceros bicornis minor TaxID=77932 RepID=A0A7J7FDU6_DICBM|nr:hypothetical protein HPG69_011257 [Diceros bicornis minor]